MLFRMSDEANHCPCSSFHAKEQNDKKVKIHIRSLLCIMFCFFFFVVFFFSPSKEIKRSITCINVKHVKYCLLY